MKANELKDALRDLASVLQSGGAKQGAEDLRAVSKRLNGDETLSAKHAIDALEAELTAPASDSAKPEAGPPKLATQRHLKALNEAGLDAGAFKAAFDAVTTDRTLLKDDVIALMKNYASAHIRAKTKKAALEEIKREFSRRQYDNNTREQARTTPW